MIHGLLKLWSGGTSKSCVSVNSKLTPLIVRSLVFGQQVLSERNGQHLVYRSGLDKTRLTVFLLNVHVVPKPTSINSHRVRMTLRLGTVVSIVTVSNRAFPLNLLPILMTIANLHTHAL
jgi:hypothetical protein